MRKSKKTVEKQTRKYTFPVAGLCQAYGIALLILRQKHTFLRAI